MLVAGLRALASDEEPSTLGKLTSYSEALQRKGKARGRRVGLYTARQRVRAPPPTSRRVMAGFIILFYFISCVLCNMITSLVRAPPPTSRHVMAGFIFLHFISGVLCNIITALVTSVVLAHGYLDVLVLHVIGGMQS